MRGRAGNLLWIGVPGTGAPEARERLDEIHPSGVVLFRRNVSDAAQLHDLIAGIRRQDPSIHVALDQEGGRVDRLAPLLGPSPPARSLAGYGRRAAGAFGVLTGRALRLLGLDVDLAPVLDLDRRQEEGAIGDRSWGRDPEEVAILCGAFLEGLEAEGITGCLKHWPGLGRARLDPHSVLPRVDAGREEVREDLEPFRRLAPPARLVMTAHCLYPALGAADRPATCAPPVLALLREVGFRGCILADDLEMGAMEGDPAAAAVAAVEAGCDALLLCGADAGPARAAVEGLLETPSLAEAIEAAAERIAALTPAPPACPFDTRAWQSLRDEYRRFCDPLLEEEADWSDPTDGA